VLIAWYLCSVPNLVQISVIETEIDALMLQRSFDDVTRINFRFRLLVTWSSPHGRDVFSHKILSDIFIQSGVIDIFFEIKDGGRRRLGFIGGAMGPPTKAYSWCVLPVKISS